ncbi:hypothetical protein [Dyella sp. ASV21]|jgi:hypothetical protein|uniref:hypothetical protein n=1 Tax=Dyella sp. ASV21 TaxID=2795114 RepID=UPI0018EA3607|nr:hypothetical protein [Dyella sp. ASV21]
MGGSRDVDDNSGNASNYELIQAAEQQAEADKQDGMQQFYRASRADSTRTREAWASLDGMFKAIHDRIGPVDPEAVRRRDALYDLLEDNGVEAMALLQVLKELYQDEAVDVAMAVEADMRAAWNHSEVEAIQVAQVHSLHEARLAKRARTLR